MRDRRFTLEIADDPDALTRVVALCRRRRCELTAVTYRAADRHRRGELRLSVRGPDWYVDRLAGWLAALVPVLRVDDLDASGSHQLPPRPTGVSG